MTAVISGKLITAAVLFTVTKATVMLSKKANKDRMAEGLDQQGLTLLDLVLGKKAG